MYSLMWGHIALSFIISFINVSLQTLRELTPVLAYLVIFTNDECEDTDDVHYIDTTTLRGLKGLQVLHHNVRSLFNKLDIIRYGFLEDSMDILCFSESLLTKDIPDELVNIDDFILARNDRHYGRGGGGEGLVYV